jgi:hypothetical protein
LVPIADAVGIRVHGFRPAYGERPSPSDIQRENAMNRRSLLTVSAATALGLALLAGNAVAQQKSLKEQLTGTWSLVSITSKLPDGSKSDPYGSNPKGVLSLENNGRLSFIITASNLPKFASNNRATGTADENKAVVQGSIGYFGTYTVDAADKSYTIRVEGSTFPNSTGLSQKRMVAISGDDLMITNPAGTAGGTAESKWKRISSVATN